MGSDKPKLRAYAEAVIASRREDAGLVVRIVDEPRARP